MAQGKLRGAAKTSRGFCAGKGYTVRHNVVGREHVVEYKHVGKAPKRFVGSAALAKGAFVDYVAEANGK